MGAIIAIVMLAARSLSPAGQIAFLLTRARQARETLDSIERLDDAGDERRRGGSIGSSALHGSAIELESVRFAYPDSERSALEDIDLRIEPGERIAVIGRVASGKSTLGRVLCGLYEPTDGAMLVGGLDSRQFRPQQLRGAFRYVGQDSALFTGSVRENLALGHDGAHEEKLIAAMRATGADEFLARDASGFDRAVGEGGRSLSGGQRSFLALTRALVAPAQMLFLDEPTGTMDSQTEKLFVERLSGALRKDQTLVIATHRPALFDICDRLIVLDRGRIVADGPIAEIAAGLAMRAQGGGGQ
jgi:ATP-binding cassette subfamily C protein LapB